MILPCLYLVAFATSVLAQKAPVHDDIFSSVAKMEGLVHQESNIINLLNIYLNAARDRFQIIQNYVSTYEQLVKDEISSSTLVANPVDAYLLLKRLTIEWEVVEKVLQHEANSTIGLLDHISSMQHQSILPKQEDLHGAAIALVRLQDTYRLNVNDLAEGHFAGVQHSEQVFQSRCDMSGRDCFFLAEHALARGNYDTAIEWARASLVRAQKLFDQGNDIDEIDSLKKQVQEFVQFATKVRQGSEHQNALIKKNLTETGESKVKVADAVENGDFVPKLHQYQTEEEENDHYNRLCRGEKLMSDRDEARLRCRLVTHNRPYLLLQPIKVEEQSLDPLIVVFHDLLTERQTDILRQLGEPKLRTSMHRGSEGFVRSMIRTSKNAWLQEHENSSLPAIRQRMELISGLRLQRESASEHFQIANYGIGGLYVTHTDNVIHPEHEVQDPWNLAVGDRIATLMVYLTDVEAGGATVFPRAGVTCWPRKGSAAFWFNLYRNGDPDPDTRHGACPVLHGSKWVSNKWIRQFDQMFVAKCGLNFLDKFQLL